MAFTDAPRNASMYGSLIVWSNGRNTAAVENLAVLLDANPLLEQQTYNLLGKELEAEVEAAIAALPHTS